MVLWAHNGHYPKTADTSTKIKVYFPKLLKTHMYKSIPDFFAFRLPPQTYNWTESQTIPGAPLVSSLQDYQIFQSKAMLDP